MKKTKAMKKFLIKFFVVLFVPFFSFSQADTLFLKQLQIKAPRKTYFISDNYRITNLLTKNEIKKIPSVNLSEILSQSQSIDIQSRGYNDVQADINILGGNFEQNIILLNGFKFNNRQTGHFNLNLPISVLSLSQIEILYGTDALIYGINGFSGALNFITEFDKTFFNNTAIWGQNNFIFYNATANFKTKKFTNFFSFEYSHSDGYDIDTDFDIYKFFYFGKFVNKHFIFKYQFGVLWKNFGAYKFYTEKFPYQYEHNNAENLDFSLFYKKLKIKLISSFHRHQDKFELFREGENWYKFSGGYFVKDNDTAFLAPNIPYTHHNYHLIYQSDFNLLKTFDLKFSNLTIGSNLSVAKIFSNILGNDSIWKKVPFENNQYFNKTAFSYILSSYVNYEIKFNRIRALASVNYILQDGKNDYCYGLNISFLQKNSSSLNLSVNSAVRFPSLTEMFYTDPIHQGNPNLKNEKNINLEINEKIISKKLIFQSGLFYRYNYNLIGWQLDSGIFKAKNIEKYPIWGFTANVKFSLKKGLLKKIMLSYSFLHKDTTNGYFLYISDYPKHLLTTNLIFGYKQLGFTINTIYKIRETFDENVAQGYKNYVLLNAKIWFSKKDFDIFLIINNLLNQEYYEFRYPQIKMPPRWIKVGIKLKF